MSAIVAAGIAVGSAVLSGVVSNRNKRNSNEMLMAQQGRRNAALDYQATRKQEQLVGQARAIQETDLRNKVRIEQQAANRAAAAQVEAAAAGTTGQAVDLASIEAQAAGGRRHGDRERATQSQLRKLESLSRNINISARAGQDILDLDYSLTGEGLGSLIRSAGFLQAGFSTGLSLGG